MLAIFVQTLPFFALIGTGWLAGWRGFFPADATVWLTRFVFYFALSAMLLRLAMGLDIAGLFDGRFVTAYLAGSLAVWAAVIGLARARGAPVPEAAMLAHAAIVGNTGFLGVPMLAVLLGPASIAPLLIVLTLDMVVFSTLITLIVAAAGHGRIAPGMFAPILRGLAANPMIVSVLAGLAWSGLRLPVPQAVDAFLALLGGAATPGALFAIGASLAIRPARRPVPALSLSLAKLVLHPAAVGAAAMALSVDPVPAGVMVAAAALPVAGNVYMLADHFSLAVERVSAAILFSTALSILTVPIVITLIAKG